MNKIIHLKKIICSVSLVLAFAAGPTVASEDKTPENKTVEAAERAAINQLMDGFHDAAAKGDKERYLGYFNGNGVFMGTDDWERWPVNPDFTKYVTEHFKDGKGWSYKAISRHIAFSPDHNVAWFDEITKSEKWGLFRGTGVLLKQDKGWKLAHYAMSVLVPNEVWAAVSDLNKAAVAQREREKK